MYRAEQHRQKYTSLVVSVLLHALMLLLLILFKMQQEPVSLQTGDAEKSTTPARVSYQPFVPTKSPSITPRPALPVSSKPLQKQAEPSREKQEQQITTEESTEEAPAPEVLQNNIVDAPTAVPTEGSYSPFANTGRKRRRKPGSSSITGTDFMRALRQSIHRERAEQMIQDEAQSTIYGQPSKPEEIAKARLEEWGEFHYRQRIMKAVGHESLIHAKYITPSQSVRQYITVEISIDKKGHLVKMTEKPSGIQEVDEFLQTILKATDFPPIPARYNKDIYTYTFRIWMELNKDGFYKLHVP